MSNNQAVWPDLVFASLLMLAGVLMLRYGVWHLVHHHEVVSPLLAGSGALVLGALSVKQVLRSRSLHGRRHKRRHAANRTRCWFWGIVISASANGFASAQIARDTLDGFETPVPTSMSSESIVPIQSPPRKYDLNRVAHYGIGGVLNLQSMEREQKMEENFPPEQIKEYESALGHENE